VPCLVLKTVWTTQKGGRRRTEIAKVEPDRQCVIENQLLSKQVGIARGLGGERDSRRKRDGEEKKKMTNREKYLTTRNESKRRRESKWKKNKECENILV